MGKSDIVKKLRQKEILIEEDLEITAATYGAVPVRLPGKVLSIFPVFVHRNFQLYFAGQAVSLLGFWLHQVGMGWLVFQLTHSAFWVGTVAAVGGLPFLIFTSFAGVYVDRVNKQKLLIFTQFAEALIALSLGLLVLTSNASLLAILILVFINGVVAAVDLPARLAFLVEMVGRKDLPSAVPVNTGLFNAARFIGPALAGALIATVGVAWTFILNGLSFLPGILAILAIRPIYNYKAEVDVHPWQSLKAGLKYSFGHVQISYFLILAAATAIFVWPYQTLMPLIADRVFAVGPGGLGSLLSASGLGSLTGAIFTSSQSKRNNQGFLIFLGLVLSGASLLFFAANHNFILAHVFLFVVGFGTLIQVSTISTLVQLASPDQMRGRIMAVYLTMFVGVMPLGNALMGTLAEKTSALFTIGFGGVAIMLVGIYFYLKGTFANFSKV